MTSRHHYSIPGASLLKTRTSSKSSTQKPTVTNTAVPSTSRDARQPSSSRAAQYTQDAANNRQAQSTRPSTANGNRQPPPASAPAHATAFPSASTSRPGPAPAATSAHRSSTMPNSYGYTQPASQPQASSSKARLDVPDTRGYFSKMFGRKPSPVPKSGDEKHYYSAPGKSAAPRHQHTGSLPNWGTYESTLRVRSDSDKEREDRARLKARDDRIRAKDERARAEYAAYMAKTEAEQTHAAQLQAPPSGTRAHRAERQSSRAPREERRVPEYESDTVRKRQQMQHGPSAGVNAPITSTQHNNGHTHPPAHLPQHSTPPVPAPHESALQPGIAIQPSASSHSTNASQRPHQTLNTASTQTPEAGNPISANGTPELGGQAESQKRPQASLYPDPPKTSNPFGQLQRPSTPPPPPAKMPVANVPSTSDERARLMREAALRDAQIVREVEAQRLREKELEAERERAKKEEKRARRAERERQKEAERAERARQEELERLERERQREFERREKERIKAAERAERERQKEAERLERERMRERERERERERQYKANTRTRTHRNDKIRSTPIPLTSGVATGSDQERYRQTRNRSQSATVAPGGYPIISQAENSSPESRKEFAPTSAAAPGPIAAHGSVSRRDTLAPDVVESPAALPIPPPLNERHDVLYPRSMSAAPQLSQGQQHTPPSMPGRARADSFAIADEQARNEMNGRPDPLAAAAQSRLVSIYAAQGPSDRTPDFFTHKIDPTTPGQEYLTTPASMATPNLAVPSGVGQRARTTSQDRAGYRQSMAFANGGVSSGPAPRPLSRVAPPLQREPSVTSLRQSMLRPQAQSSTPIASAQDGNRFDAEHGGFAAGNSLAPPDVTERIQKTPSAGSQRPSQNRPISTVPTGHIPQTGFSSYSRSIATQAALVPPAQASRVNSDRSAKHNFLTPLPGENLLSIPISRNPSDSSGSTEVDTHRPTPLHTMHTPQGNSQAHHFTPSMPSSNMHSSANYSSASKAAQELSSMKPPQNNAYAPHVHNLAQTSGHVPSSVQQHTAVTPENNPTRGTNLHSGHTNSHNRTSAIASTPQDRYSHDHQDFNQPAPPRNASANVYFSAPSQSQSQAQNHQTSTSTHEHNITATTPTAPLYPLSTRTANAPTSHRQSVLLSSQAVNAPSSSALYHNHSNTRHDPPTQQRLHATNGTKPSPPAPGNTPLSRNPARSSLYMTSAQQSGLNAGEETLTPVAPSAVIDAAANDRPHEQQSQTPISSSAPVSHNRPLSIIASTPTTPRPNNGQTRPSSRDTARVQDRDIPPPLTPSTSSGESHEEILMTPSSLDVSRTQNVTIQRSDSQRSEKKRTGIFGLFRSNNAKTKPSLRPTPTPVAEQRPAEGRRSVSGPAENVASENFGVGYVGGARLSRISSTPAEAMGGATPSGPQTQRTTGAAGNPNRQSRSSRPVPPPIAIPLQSHSIPYRLFTSKSKRYRTMSSASMEALDGTANNTVVGSPTSSRFSTMSGAGPLTPPARDAAQATKEWRNNEEKAFEGMGSQRRRRPGVTFDNVEEDSTKNGAQYRARRRRQREISRYGLDAMLASDSSA